MYEHPLENRERNLLIPISTKVTNEEREEWLSHLSEVAVSSDAFVSPLVFPKSCWINNADSGVQFPFIDNVLRASRSGVK